MRGGAIGGFIAALIAIAFKDWNGFGEFPPARLVPLIIAANTAGGAATGWLCCRAAWSNMHRSPPAKYMLTAVALANTAAIIFFLVHQVPARDALVQCGTYLQRNGRLGGGPFGEPDFESIAVSFTAGVIALILLRALVEVRVPTARTTLGIVLFGTVIGVSAWSLVYLAYLVVIGLLRVPRLATVISSCYFVVDFPHPERAIMWAPIICAFCLCILASIQLHAREPHIRLSAHERDPKDK